MKKLLLVFLSIPSFAATFGQCPLGVNSFQTIDVTTGNCIPTCVSSGEYVTLTGLRPGLTYSIQTCTNVCGIDFDTQITIYKQNGTMVGVNDDNGPTCSGMQASVRFVSDTTAWIVQVNHAFCQSDSNLVTTLNVSTPDTLQNIMLGAGWNMISSNIIPNAPDMLNTLSGISQNVQLVKDGQGQIAIPSQGTNAIGNWDVAQSYQVKATNLTTLTITGTQVDLLTAAPISLNAGWNMTAYLRQCEMDITVALSSIAGDIDMVKNGAGRVYIPSLGINTIGNMVPGQGYKIKVSNNVTLIYPGN